MTISVSRTRGSPKPFHAAAQAALLRMLWVVLVLGGIASAASAEDYHLGPMDRLRIKVVEWQTAEGSFRDWSAVSGDYTVGPSGALSLPFIGEAEASGKTTAEIAAMIGEKLQQKFGLLDRPEASVELAEYRPFFISGDVESPGKFPFAPDLTVLKAVSIAGGIRRGSDNGQRAERDFINAQGNHAVLIDQRNRLVAKQARLRAEASNKADIVLPAELKERAELAPLLADESNVMATRSQTLKLQLSSLGDLKNLLTSEVEALSKKTVSQTRQLELAKGELADVGGLADKGLVVNTRVSGLERSVAEIESRLLDIGTSSLRAKQDINKATQDEVNLRNDRTAEIAAELQSVDADLEAANLKIAMYSNLMAEALSISPDAGAGADAPPPQFVILRSLDGEPKEIEADETTPVLPGDVVKVKILPPPSQ